MKYLLLAGCLFLASCAELPCPFTVGDLVFIKVLNEGPYVISQVYPFCNIVQVMDKNLNKRDFPIELLEKRIDPRG